MGGITGAPRPEWQEAVLRVMDQKHHWFWDHLHGPHATREQLLLHFQQEWEVYVRDFPVFLRRIHERCPHPEVREAIAHNVAEEETGAESGAGPHNDLFLYMMEGLGFPRRAFDRVQLLAPAAAYRGWIDEATSGSWLVGAAVTIIFVEGSVLDRAELDGEAPEEPPTDLSRHPLVVHQGIDPKYLELKRVHACVEGGHRRDAWRAVVDHAATDGDRRDVRATVSRSLVLWRSYRDAVATAVIEDLGSSRGPLF